MENAQSQLKISSQLSRTLYFNYLFELNFQQASSMANGPKLKDLLNRTVRWSRKFSKDLNSYMKDSNLSFSPKKRINLIREKKFDEHRVCLGGCSDLNVVDISLKNVKKFNQMLKSRMFVGTSS